MTAPHSAPRVPKPAPCVIFATPSLSHTVTLDFLRSWTNTVWALKDAGIAHGRIDRGGDCFIDKVRNKLVQEFLDGPGTDLFFLDDDLGWPAEAVMRFIARPEPILAGVYPKKADDPDWPVALDADAATGELITDQGLYLASFAGCGFLRIKREVLETLVKLVPPFKDPELNGKTGTYPMLFETGIDDRGWYQGEDVSFFRLARAHGFPLWVDPDIAFRHRGGKTWSGTLIDHLETFRAKAKVAVANTATETDHA